MNFTLLDWSAIILYLGITLALGLYFRSRSGKSVDEFFLSGRNVPWWLAGTSMVATTFAADTPLAVTGMVARQRHRRQLAVVELRPSGMLTVFFYARLWRRSGRHDRRRVRRDPLLRASPRRSCAASARCTSGIPINCIILGWVNLAMVKILVLILGVTKLQGPGHRDRPDCHSPSLSRRSPDCGACW